MSNIKLYSRMLLALLLLVVFLTSHSVVLAKEKPIIVCTTSVLASIAKDLVGDKAIVEVIASPAVCPAHYDVKPSDVETFKEADLILMHGMEQWVKALKEASGSNALIVKIPGSWNSPDALKARYEAVAKAIEDNLGIDVSDRLGKCINKIDDLGKYLKEYSKKHGFEGVPVVCMAWQVAFIKYLGFKIVATYGPPEKVTAKEYSEIIKNATSAGAILVIDNIQSGTELGKKIALEIGGVEVALTDFPGISPEMNNVTAMLKWNVEKLADALAKANLQREVNILKEQLDTYRTATIVLMAITVVLVLLVIGLAIRLKTRR